MPQHSDSAQRAPIFSSPATVRKLDTTVNQSGKNNISGVQDDVSNLDLDKLYAIVREQKSSIDILFANAGVGELARLETITEAHFEKTFNVHVKGLLFTVQKALPLFQDCGSIVLNTLITGSKAADGLN